MWGSDCIGQVRVKIARGTDDARTRESTSGDICFKHYRLGIHIVTGSQVDNLHITHLIYFNKEASILSILHSVHIHDRADHIGGTLEWCRYNFIIRYCNIYKWSDVCSIIQFKAPG